ncbi:Ig-like domain-containing protein [Paenibacillus mendelii]|uniref:Ig-like domain-containing protein n=1 Tax=Paenibacillus mendelii TaxID=206163 RepID=A0ABV6JHI3_9BACL|nr:Ig-like domain-containing protein [Paenibacillus mendelii]MCQ6557159.1 Ig-like domain-containing protein [Paenibacillus mendelii]
MIFKRSKKWISLLTVLCLWVSCLGMPNTAVFAEQSEAVAVAAVPGLAGEWKFDEMNGSVTPDTRSRNDAIVSKAALGTGFNGKALLFNGYDSFATIPNDELINTGSDFSMSMLVNFNSTYTNRNVVFVQQQGENGATLLQRRPDGRLQSSLGGVSTIGATLIEPKKWYHVALVREGAKVKLYVNGTLDAEKDNTHMDSNTGDIRIGADRFPDSSNAWPGYIDELQIYDRALTDDQLRQVPGHDWPVITMNGSAELTLEFNQAYDEAGASATDSVDGNLTVVSPTGQVDTSKGGIYPVKYTVSNSRGESVTKVRTVTVIPPKTLSRASRVLIDKGLQMQTWMTTEGSGRKFASADEWTGSHFTTATYYEYPFYNQTLHNNVPYLQWSLVKGAFGDGLGGGPKESDMNGFLSPQQTADVNNLITISFGDEEGYSEEILKTFTDWFKLSHQLYPNVLAHSNQQSRQWQRDNYETYIKTAEPDLLTFDDYLFSLGGTDKNMFTTIVNNINDQRTIALGGYDRTGQSPIAFGQYLLGFKTNKMPADVGPYIITESQIYGVPFATLTMGGKWLSMFRWEYDSSSFLFFDKDGKTTPQYDQYAEMARQINHLGPHLVRLNSTDVFIVPGQYKDETGAVMNNKTPKETPVLDKYNRLSHPYLRSMSVQNLGTENNGLNGDALIGFFDPLPDTQDFFGSMDKQYFMVMNGLTTGNGLLPDQQHGSGSDTKQSITLELNLAQYAPGAIQRVSRETGQLEPVELKPLGGNRYELNVTLNGGVADLFQLDKSMVNPSYAAVESVSLPSAMNMNAGDTTKLSAVVAPANATEQGVEWSSSNESIAAVDTNGEVTAIAGGTAVITASTIDGDRMARTAITVTSVNVPVTGITISPATVSLYTEETTKLTPLITPTNASNKAVVWSSSDERIAQVDQEGTVTAISPGSVEIAATTVDGSMKALSQVTVLDASSEASLSDLIINNGQTDLGFNSSTFDYTVKINPNTDSMTLQPRLKNSKGQMLVNGMLVNSGQLITAKIPMGNSKIEIITQAPDGISSKTYSVVVKRNKNLALEASSARATHKEHGQDWSANDYDNDSEHSPLRMIDGKADTYFQSAAMEELNAKGEFEPPHRILLEWDDSNLQDFNKLVLVVNKAQQQGLTVLDISTSEDGMNWEETKSSVYLSWQTDSPDEYEQVTVNLPDYKAHYGADYKGLKGIYLLLWKANLDAEDRYAISEFELYNEKDATEPVEITVTDIPVTGIEIAPSSVDLLIHETAKLNTVFAPVNASNQSVQWSSSDPRIASVNAKGIVAAISAGTATMTATTDDGQYTASSTVQVTNPNSDASLSALVVNGGSTNISFNSNKTDYTMNLDPSVDTVTLQPTLKKADSTMKVNGLSLTAAQWISAKVPMGNSKIEIAVTAADGATVKTYTFTIKRNKNLAREASAARATYLNHGQDWNANDYANEGEHSPIRMIDGKADTYFQSASMPDLNAKGEFEPPHRIMLEWDDHKLQDFNKLVLVVNKAQQQGLTVLDISTSEDAVNWEETKSSVYLTWQTDSSDEYERVTIDLPDYKAHYGADYKGLKGIYLLLWKANLNTEDKYAISAFELYNEKDATEPVQITIQGTVTPPVTPNPPITPITPVTPPTGSVADGIIKLGVPKVDESTGEAAAAVSTGDWSKALETASAGANGLTIVRIEVPKADNAKSYVVELPQSALASDAAKTKVEIVTEFGTITAPSDMLNGLNLTGVKSIAISISAADRSTLEPAVSAQIGNRPVVELHVMIDGKVVPWSSPIAPVLVSIPYQPTPVELADPEHIVVWYIDNAGKAVPVPNGKYDAATGSVTFKTSHFSKYAVVFVKKSFRDISSLRWAKKQIEVMASKGVINGTSSAAFAPTKPITRADFVALLVRALELTASEQDGSFSDVDASAYYSREVGVAKSLGITTGTGDGTFKPLRSISRQEALVLMYKAMKAAGKPIAEVSPSAVLNRFADKEKIASYASDGIAALVQSGLIQGDGVSIHPQDTLTRAEAAVMMYNMLSHE